MIMCFTTEMRDILPKEKPLADNDTLEWYLHEMLLCYKYNYKERYMRALSALNKILPRQVLYLLIQLGDTYLK